MKKSQLYLVIALALVAVVGGVFFFKNKKKSETADTKTPARKVEQINKLAIKDRPYVVLTPRADGKEVTLTIDNVMGATNAEYEMEYTAGAMIQGVFGTIDFSEEPAPVSKELLFGSCSKGKCKYDDNVSGGSLTLRVEGQGDPYVLKSDFNLQLMSDREGVFTSKDIKAKLDVGTSLPSSTYVVVAGTMGLPAELEGEVLAGPYSFTTASTKAIKGNLTIQSKDDLTDAKLMFYTGTAWTELTSALSEGKISAPVTSLGTFVLVK
ncbi:hypothetical protein ACFL18_01595 [Patescibacteria group bacterium]